jgi:biopolymer transport protein TolR
VKSSHKIRRVERQFAQGGRAVPINIVSMIDIFAILVFYLLVSIAAVEMRPNDPSLQLPKSTSIDRPHEATQLQITRKDILVDHNFVISTADASAAAGNTLPSLKAEFEQKVALMQAADSNGGVTRGEINILADKDIPYSLLKKVMATCTEARFARISLAVTRRKGEVP